MSPLPQNNGLPMVAMNQIIDQIHNKYYKINSSLVHENAELSASQEAMISHLNEQDAKMRALLADNEQMVKESAEQDETIANLTDKLAEASRQITGLMSEPE